MREQTNGENVWNSRFDFISNRSEPRRGARRVIRAGRELE